MRCRFPRFPLYSNCRTEVSSIALYDPIAGHAEQPSGNLLRRFHHPVGLDELVENILQNVFCIALVGHSPLDEVAKPALLPLDRFGDSLVLLRHEPPFSQRLVHLRL